MDSSEEVDAFTTEYKKILKQLPSMLKPTEPIPEHLQNYMKSQDTSNISSSKPYHNNYKYNKSKSKRKHNRYKSRHQHNEINPKFNNKNKRDFVDDLNDDIKDKKSKYYIENNAKYIDDDKNNDIVTIQELKRMNKMLLSETDKIEYNSISIQTERENKRENTTNSKMNELIEKLTNELNDKSSKCEELKEDNICLERELKERKKELIEINMKISGWKQEIEDKQIYCNNLIKHLDEKSRNEALLRNEINEQQKQLQSAHIKLQQFFNKKELNELKELREHLIISQQKCLDWKQKWKQQCYKIEQLQSDKIMSEHRVDQQLIEYQKIIQDFRNMMKNNLNSVNINFENLNKENIALKQENEKLLFELGKIQENTFKNDIFHKNQENVQKNNEIIKLTEKLTNFERNLEKNHLNGTMDKSIQCIIDNNINLIDDEFNQISIEIYKLIINLKSKTFDIVNEYGFKSLTNTPRNNKKIKRYDIDIDTDDIDITSMIINCKKRFSESKQILKQLLKWFDDFMYEQAEKQCDNCITQ